MTVEVRTAAKVALDLAGAATAADLAIDVGLALIQAAAQISSIITGAQSAGRDVLSQEEWSGILRIADAAETAAEAAVAALAPPAASVPPPVDPGAGAPADPNAGGASGSAPEAPAAAGAPVTPPETPPAA